MLEEQNLCEYYDTSIIGQHNCVMRVAAVECIFLIALTVRGTEFLWYLNAKFWGDTLTYTYFRS